MHQGTNKHSIEIKPHHLGLLLICLLTGTYYTLTAKLYPSVISLGDSQVALPSALFPRHVKCSFSIHSVKCPNNSAER